MQEHFRQDIDMNEENLKGRQEFWSIMELPELSLAPTQCVVSKSTNTTSSSDSETFPSRKRKSLSDHFLKTQPMIHTSHVDLQLKDPLPLDWEQCLDLKSGRMYYLNRKTLRKSWEWPKDQKLDLELNISTLEAANCSQKCRGRSSETLEEEEEENSISKKLLHSSSSSSNNSSNMVALACLNCHLLVILSKSSPSCPNCKEREKHPTGIVRICNTFGSSECKQFAETLSSNNHSGSGGWLPFQEKINE